MELLTVDIHLNTQILTLKLMGINLNLHFMDRHSLYLVMQIQYKGIYK